MFSLFSFFLSVVQVGKVVARVRGGRVQHCLEEQRHGSIVELPWNRLVGRKC